MKKQMLIILLVMGNWITGCGGGDGGEEPKILTDGYSSWASLLKNSPEEENFKYSTVLPNGKKIIGYKNNLGGEIKYILTLPLSSLLKSEEFEEDFDPKDMKLDIDGLNKNIESYPKFAIHLHTMIQQQIREHEQCTDFVSYRPYPARLLQNEILKVNQARLVADKYGNYSRENKKLIQARVDQTGHCSFRNKGGNFKTIPVKVIQDPQGEYWIEFTLIDSGTYKYIPQISYSKWQPY